MSFTDLGLHKSLRSRLEKLGYTQPAPAHEQLLPLMLEGTDVLVACTVGAGCTEAALFALLHRCMQSPDSDLAHNIVLTPSESHTARMANRIQGIAGNTVAINIISDSKPHTSTERSVPLITISTPSHFLSRIPATASPAPTTLLLTEADEMIARGAKTTLLDLGDILSGKPQVLIFTGRETRSVTVVSKVLQHDPLRHTLKPDGEYPASIPQQAWPVASHLKTSLLVKLYRRIHTTSMLVIADDEEIADYLAHRLRTVESSAATLYNNDSAERQTSLRNRFEAGEIKLLLLAGNIPAKLRVEKVTHVVNYGLPSDITVYFNMLHRVPRAVHLNLVSPREEERVLEIEDRIGRPLFRDFLPDFDYSQQERKRERPSRPKRKRRPSRHLGKPPSKKHEWDPETPRTWGDRNAPRKDPAKIPLAEWSPEPLPGISTEQKASSNPTTAKPAARGRPSRRRRGGRRSRNNKK